MSPINTPNDVPEPGDPCFFRVDTSDSHYNVSFEITNTCNFQCTHCFNESHSEGFGGPDRANLLQLIRELGHSGAKNVYLTGGEPTRYRWFADALQEFANQGIEVILATNGYDLDRATDLILTYVSRRLGVFVSIDGLAERHDTVRNKQGAFERTLANIESLLEQGMPVRVSTVVTEESLAELAPLLALLQRTGVAQVNLTSPVGIGRAKPFGVASGPESLRLAQAVQVIGSQFDSPEFRVVVKRSLPLQRSAPPCQAGTGMMHIDCRTVVHPCSWVAKAGLNQFSRQWEPGTMAECIATVRGFQKLVDDRIARFGCSGCPAMAKIARGSALAEDPIFAWSLAEGGAAS